MRFQDLISLVLRCFPGALLFATYWVPLLLFLCLYSTFGFPTFEKPSPGVCQFDVQVLLVLIQKRSHFVCHAGHLDLLNVWLQPSPCQVTPHEPLYQVGGLVVCHCHHFHILILNPVHSPPSLNHNYRWQLSESNLSELQPLYTRPYPSLYFHCGLFVSLIYVFLSHFENKLNFLLHVVLLIMLA